MTRLRLLVCVIIGHSSSGRQFDFNGNDIELSLIECPRCGLWQGQLTIDIPSDVSGEL